MIDNLALLRSAQQQAAKAALDAVEAEKANQAAVEATPAGLEASLSTQVGSGPKWLRGAVVTAYVRSGWDRAKAVVRGVRGVKKF